jgi:hypothetical protein
MALSDQPTGVASGNLFVPLYGGRDILEIYPDEEFLEDLVGQDQATYATIREAVLRESPFIRYNGILSFLNARREKAYMKQVEQTIFRQLAEASEPYYAAKSAMHSQLIDLVNAAYANQGKLKDGHIGQLAIAEHTFPVSLNIRTFEHRKNIPFMVLKLEPFTIDLDENPRGFLPALHDPYRIELETGAYPDEFGNLWRDAFFDAYYFSLQSK